MTDRRKFNVAMITGVVLVAAVLASNTVLEPLLTGLGERMKRRSHYEDVISRKGLSLHRGVFWKEKPGSKD
jgi:hypothetical protein